jgi:hypothetical protein
MPEAVPSSNEGAAQSGSTCYKCGANLDLHVPNVCPVCGRRQTRGCFCGTVIRRGPVVCPECGVDWGRIRRSPRSSRKQINSRDLAVNSIAGGLIALACAALIYFLVTGGGQALASIVSSTVASTWPRVSEVTTQMAVPLAVFATGCLVGAIRYYLTRRTGGRGRPKTLARKRSKGTG